LQPQVFSGNTSFRMNYNLDATSYVEYYGNGNQVVTGKFPNAGVLADVTLASTAQHHYGYLDINNQGTLGTNHCYPAIPAAGTGNVFVRTSLLLTRGELNLAGSGTGQTITIENGAANGITRDGATTTGYIKSEEQNAGNNRAKVMWNMGTNTGAHIYPFGVTTGATNYIPFTFNKTTAGSSNITVSTRISSGGSNNTPWAAASNVAAVTTMESVMAGLTDASVQSVIDRWWDITSSAAVTSNITFSFRGVENTTTSNPTGEFKAQHWNGTSWDAPVGTGTGVTGAAVGTVTANGQTTFSPWILSSLLIPLPVELEKFKADCDGNTATFEWRTASETNNNYFTIEKSLDGFNYYEVGKIYSQVKGSPSSSSSLDYSFVDNNPTNAYYRLNQTDFSNTSKNLKLIHLNKCITNKQFINAFSVNDAIVIQTDVESKGEVIATVMNSLGQIVATSTINLHEGFSEFKMENLGVTNGIYYLSISGKTIETFNKKLLLTK